PVTSPDTVTSLNSNGKLNGNSKPPVLDGRPVCTICQPSAGGTGNPGAIGPPGPPRYQCGSSATTVHDQVKNRSCITSGSTPPSRRTMRVWSPDGQCTVTGTGSTDTARSSSATRPGMLPADRYSHMPVRPIALLVRYAFVDHAPSCWTRPPVATRTPAPPSPTGVSTVHSTPSTAGPLNRRPFRVTGTAFTADPPIVDRQRSGPRPG